MSVDVVSQVSTSESSCIDESLVALQDRHTELLDFVESMFVQMEELRSDVEAKSGELGRQTNELAQKEEDLASQRHNAEQLSNTFAEQQQIQSELLTELQQVKNELNSERESCHSQISHIIERTEQEVKRLREEREQFQEKVFDSQNSITATCEQLSQFQQHLSEAAEKRNNTSVSGEFSDEEREELETELERVRRRAAEMSEALAEQNRQASQRESDWTNELGLVRSLLEQQLTQASQMPQPVVVAQPAADGATPPVNPATMVVGTVMDQFAKLQEDATRRRAAGTD